MHAKSFSAYLLSPPAVTTSAFRLQIERTRFLLESKFLPGMSWENRTLLAPRPHSALEDVRPLRPGTACSRLPLHHSSVPLGRRHAERGAKLAHEERHAGWLRN